MILIDSTYINNGGGRILLDYLVEVFQKQEIEVFYLFDDRCSDSFSAISKKNKIFLKASFYNRYNFYKQNQHHYKTILCFGNIPPPIKVDAKVYTYFHQKLFLELPSGTSLKNVLIFKLKSFIWRSLKKNTDYWIVQSETMANNLKTKLKLLSGKILVLPFYPPLSNQVVNGKREKNSFIYVSSGSAHKNHLFLINAFCSFYDKNKLGNLAVTIGKEFPLLLSLIKEKNSLGYPILNYGHLKRDQLSEIYPLYEYHIYPSLSESFGLGLLESMENGCKIIGANLPYTYAVCKPSITFSTSDTKSLELAFEKAERKDEEETRQMVFNEINKLVTLLQL